MRTVGVIGGRLPEGPAPGQRPDIPRVVPTPGPGRDLGPRAQYFTVSRPKIWFRV